MENRKEVSSDKNMNKKDNLNSLKQLIHTNKKKNMVLKKILKKINSKFENDEQNY